MRKWVLTVRDPLLSEFWSEKDEKIFTLRGTWEILTVVILWCKSPIEDARRGRGHEKRCFGAAGSARNRERIIRGYIWPIWWPCMEIETYILSVKTKILDNN
jgi:hypothetical protein